jgi:plasmid stabilization system protein ParE
LVEYTPEALRQVDDLLQYYEGLQRDSASRALLAALQAAERRIDERPDAGLPAPRPYPQLAQQDRAWIKSGRYWITYRTGPFPVIAGVFFETADIPRRLAPP